MSEKKVTALTNDTEIDGQKFVCLSIIFRKHQEHLMQEHEKYKKELTEEKLENERKSENTEPRITEVTEEPRITEIVEENEENNEKEDVETEPKFDSNFGCIKIRGVFSTYNEAKEHAKQLQKIDPYFNIWVGEVGKWLPLDPNPDSVKDQQYYESELNALLGNEKQRLADIAAVEEQRKRDLMKSAAMSKEGLSAPEKKKKRKKKNKKKKSKVTSEELEVLKQTEQEKKETLSSMEENIKNKERELLEFNRKMEEINKLYKKTH